MGNLLNAEITIRGVRPLLWHAFGPDAIPLEKRERTGVAGNDPEEWKRTVLHTADRSLYVPATYAFSCLREGSKFTKKGKGSIQASVSATLQITSDRLVFNRRLPEEPTTDDTQLVYILVNSVRNPATKARNVRYRIAAATGWETQFTIMWDRTIVSRAEMESTTRDAGTLVGLGDGRSIGYGRFELVSFDVHER
jgi:hypothetical protein